MQAAAPKQPTRSAGPYVYVDDDGQASLHPTFTWLYDAEDPANGVYESSTGTYCIIPNARMRLLGFEHDPPTPQEQVQRQEKRRYQNRSRSTAPQRAKRPATEKQIWKINQLRRALGYSQLTVLKMNPRPVQELCDLMLWEASRLIDKLQEV